MVPGRTLLVAVLLASACTYGPPEERRTVEQIVRLGDSYRAVGIVSTERFRQPTGLSAFPDGGRARVLVQEATAYLLDVDSGQAIELHRWAAPDSLWEAFDAHVTGVENDSTIYVRLIGCPRGGQCYPDLGKEALFRLAPGGDSEPVASLPDGVGLPGVMSGRRPGEQRYVRFRTSRDTVLVRLAADGPYVPMWIVSPDGSLEPAG